MEVDDVRSIVLAVAQRRNQGYTVPIRQLRRPLVGRGQPAEKRYEDAALTGVLVTHDRNQVVLLKALRQPHQRPQPREKGD